MSTFVVGDVHGCAEELARLLDDVRPERALFLGDLFTKGPDPVGAFELIRPHATVLGNHDARLLDAIDGRRPDDEAAHDTVSALDRGAPGWREWLRAAPLWREAGGFTLVHAGLHPSGSLERTSREMALTMRRFPIDDPYARTWYDQYTGERRVVFGHDAARGLVRRERDGQPWLIGLDTGCVYGGALSGYLIEDDVVVKVPAVRVHRVPRGEVRRAM